MITLLGSPRRCCDGLTRRETLTAGALTLLGGGFTLPDLLAAESRRPAAARPGRAKSVILLYLLGGAATQDMWDLKPAAPAEIRGEFRPIDTSVPGVRIGEHLPRTATWMHRAAVVRSVNHKAGCHNCLPSYTGLETPMPDQHPRDTDPPSVGSVCEFLRQDRGDLPDYVYMPCWLGWGQAFRRAGPYAGFLGRRYDALTTECRPFADPGVTPTPGKPATVRGTPLLPSTAFEPDLSRDRFRTRRDLLGRLDGRLREAEVGYDRVRQRAFDLLTSSRLRTAFDLTREDPRRLDRYGRTLLGHSTLIARKLVEEGVRFVNVTWDLFWDRAKVDYDAWDTHTRNFEILRTNELPHFDQTFTALMEDLSASGLLDETLVVVMSEMGRTPRVNANAGRDHWTFCYSVVFAGGGVRGGTVYGASDAHAAYVKDRPVTPADVCATIYQALGIDPDSTVPDRGGRPVSVGQNGRPIADILA
ncbi:DUF1501 domain-containing protein [Urbifossiella limnaea]|uniref:DUF1501 domain-containing protein n=1 Tax=Urbifossiella limnaea TaxID=2528023 RepID=A0A517XN64_9BACT|nr:DUF1501 domain-containing protein [Urbifossiella limnaea]QDU18949.1 hypothetical protein ETAA1_08480 [Urbifossiella limnaea]